MYRAHVLPTSFGLLSLARVLEVHPRLRPSPRCFGLAGFASTLQAICGTGRLCLLGWASAWVVWTPMPSDLTPPVIYRQTQRGQKDHPKTLRYVPFFLEEIQSLPPAPTALHPPWVFAHTPIHGTPVPGTFKLWLALAGVLYPEAFLLVLSWVTVTAHASVANKRGWQVLMGRRGPCQPFCTPAV